MRIVKVFLQIGNGIRRNDLFELGISDLDALETFYGVRFAPGGSKAARQMAFMLYIG